MRWRDAVVLGACQQGLLGTPAAQRSYHLVEWQRGVGSGEGSRGGRSQVAHRPRPHHCRLVAAALHQHCQAGHACSPGPCISTAPPACTTPPATACGAVVPTLEHLRASPGGAGLVRSGVPLPRLPAGHAGVRTPTVEGVDP